MPTTARSRPAQSVANVLSRGISRRQGAHQVAQKLMMRDLPLQVDIAVDLPERSFKVNSGRTLGITTCVKRGSAGELSWAPGAPASPAGTGAPCWLRYEWSFNPPQTPSSTTNA